jgi:hypothetical protein
MRQLLSAVAGGMVVLVAMTTAVGTYHWLFDERVHCRTPGPKAGCDGVWVAEVTKRMQSTGSVQIRLRVVQERGDVIGSVEACIDCRDLWSDVLPGSYEVRWLSADHFEVGDKEPGSRPRWRGKRAGEMWAVEEIR